MLQVEIAERSRKCIHDIANGGGWTRVARVKSIIERRLPGSWRVGPCDVTIVAAVHLSLRESSTRIEILPISPHAVHHAVVHVEGWVAGRGEKICAWISADGVMNATVWTNLDCIWYAFGQQAVLGDVGLGEEACKGSA